MPPTATDTPTHLACRNCGGALQALQLAGHYGRGVQIDLCPPCHLVWFDSVESARLSGPGLLALIGAMAAAHTLAHQPLQPRIGCARCGAAARTVHNQTRWGHSLQIECPQGHGAWQTFAQFLQEKGLLRPLSWADRARALQRPEGLHCVNCGGAIGAADTTCAWCQSVPALVDVARLARSLDPEGALAPQAVHGRPARDTALACQACGAALPADATWHCAHCGATLTAPGLAEAHQHVATLGPALAAHAAKPAPAVVARRLEAQSAGLQRQRQRAAEMQAEADAQAGRSPAGWPLDGGSDDAAHTQVPTWLGVAVLLLALWWFWG